MINDVGNDKREQPTQVDNNGCSEILNKELNVRRHVSITMESIQVHDGSMKSKERFLETLKESSLVHPW